MKKGAPDGEAWQQHSEISLLCFTCGLNVCLYQSPQYHGVGSTLGKIPYVVFIMVGGGGGGGGGGGSDNTIRWLLYHSPSIYMYIYTPIKERSSNGNPANASRKFTGNELAVQLYERRSSGILFLNRKTRIWTQKLDGTFSIYLIWEYATPERPCLVQVTMTIKLQSLIKERPFVFITRGKHSLHIRDYICGYNPSFKTPWSNLNKIVGV